MTSDCPWSLQAAASLSFKPNESYGGRAPQYKSYTPQYPHQCNVHQLTVVTDKNLCSCVEWRHDNSALVAACYMHAAMPASKRILL